jgi:small subunit ribosomal protein S19
MNNGRSVKKGPFVAPKLLERVRQMNAADEKRVLKTSVVVHHDFP